MFLPISNPGYIEKQYSVSLDTIYSWFKDTFTVKIKSISVKN